MASLVSRAVAAVALRCLAEELDALLQETALFILQETSDGGEMADGLARVPLPWPRTLLCELWEWFDPAAHAQNARL